MSRESNARHRRIPSRGRSVVRIALATLLAVVCSFTGSAPANALFVVGASTKSGAANTCTFTAVKPAVSSGLVRATFTVKCTVITTITYGIQIRESDFTAGFQTVVNTTGSYYVFTAGFQTVVNTTGSYYVAKAGTTYTVASTTAACSSTTALGTGANTESTREELYTYVSAVWGSYTAKFEQTAVPSENSSASFAC